MLAHAIGIGGWYGSRHPLRLSRTAATPVEKQLQWTTPSDFLAEGWPTQTPPPPVVPVAHEPDAPPLPPPVVKGAFINIRRLTELPAAAATTPAGPDFTAAFHEYDSLIKRSIEEQWTPPKGPSDSPVRFKLRISVGGIVQNSGVTAKSSLVELNRSAADLLEKLDRTGKPLPEGWTAEYEVEVELRAAP